METPLRSRLRHGLGGQSFSLIVTTAVQIGGVPLFLHFWGARLYGEWLVLAALAAWVVVVDTGFTSAGLHEVTMRAARRDFDGALDVFQSVWAFVTAVSLVAVGALALGATVLPLASWFGFSELDGAGASTIVVLLLIRVFVQMQTELVALGLFGAGRYGLFALLMAVTQLAAFLLAALMLWLGGGPMSAAAAMAGVECAGFLAATGLGRRYSPWLRYGISHASLASVRRLAAPSIGFAALRAGNALGIQGPLLVVGAVIGPAAVAVFSSLRILARAPVMVSGAVFAILRPEVSIAHGRGDRGLVRRLSDRAIQLGLWLSMAAFAVAMPLGPWIVDVWTDGLIAVRQPLFVLLLAAGAGTTLWTGAMTALYATNSNREIAAVCVLAVGTGLLASIAAAFHAGLSGVAAAMAVAEFVTFALVLRKTLAFLDQRLGAVARAALRPPVDVLALLRPGR